MSDVQKIMATASATAVATATTTDVPTLYIMVGPAGSGKSTRALAIAGSENYIASADMFVDYVDGIIDIAGLPKAHELCQERVHNLMSENSPKVVLDNTNLEPKYLLPYMESAEEFGYRIEWVLPTNGILHFSNSKIRSQIDRENHCVQVRRSGEKIIPERIVRTMATNTIGLVQRIVSARREHGDEPVKWKNFCVPRVGISPTSGKKKNGGGKR